MHQTFFLSCSRTSAATNASLVLGSASGDRNGLGRRFDRLNFGTAFGEFACSSGVMLKGSVEKRPLSAPSRSRIVVGFCEPAWSRWGGRAHKLESELEELDAMRVSTDLWERLERTPVVVWLEHRCSVFSGCPSEGASTKPDRLSDEIDRVKLLDILVPTERLIGYAAQHPSQNTSASSRCLRSKLKGQHSSCC